MNIRKYTDQERYQRHLEASRRYYEKKKDDPEFKEKHKKQSKRFREKDQKWYREYQREKQRKYAEEHKEQILENSRERYQKIKSDPELLNKYKESVKRSIKKRIENDPDFRARRMAYNKEYNRKRMAARSYDFLKKSIRVSRFGFEEAKTILARKDLNVTVSYAGENVLVISFAQNDNVYRTIILSIPEEK